MPDAVVPASVVPGSVVPGDEVRDVVGIVHGYGDHSGRYLWPMEQLAARGHGCIALDYRGHGKADGARADCVQFADYIDDLDIFWERVRDSAKGKPAFILAHSHGGLIATQWLLTRKPQSDLKGVVLTSPYYQLAFEPPAVKLLAARLLRSVVPALSLGNELKPEMLSRDEAWQKETAADPLYLHNTTPRWFFEHQRAQAALAGRGRDITVPLLMLGGSADGVVSTPAARAFFETIASRDKTYTLYDGYRHELMNELGKERVIDDISQWISAHR